jgi:Xanthosine triphosphate pyrophosphatase
MAGAVDIVYVTSSTYKIEENKILREHLKLRSGTLVNDRFNFIIQHVEISELLLVDLSAMVQAEVANAYAHVRVPCMVEHAGLVFDDYRALSYPGGLTKPMWNTLGDKFLSETNSGGRRAIARAVVAYCDGMSVRTFVGETPGSLAERPRGARQFYWDTVFIPDELSGAPGSKTYAEIAEDPALGIEHKVIHLSQSTKAMMSFLEFLDQHPRSTLWGP